MLKDKLFMRTFILLCIIGVMNFVATYLYLYWTVWWIDMIMHFLSGACVAMGTVLFMEFISLNLTDKKRKVIIFGVLGALTIGIVWEFYEFFFHITSLSDGVEFWTDTSSDILLDGSGGLLGSIYSIKYLN